jgi:UDP-glucuronate 4-epimerase
MDYSLFRIFNVGNGSPVKLMDFVKTIEDELGKKANLNFQPLQAGDVQKTYANCDKLFEETGFRPNTSIQEGVKEFVSWYKRYYKAEVNKE